MRYYSIFNTKKNKPSIFILFYYSIKYFLFLIFLILIIFVYYDIICLWTFSFYPFSMKIKKKVHKDTQKQQQRNINLERRQYDKKKAFIIASNMKKLFLLFSLIACSNLLYPEIIHLGASDIYSDTGYATNIRSTTSSPFVITAREIQEKRFASLSEILASLPGITIREGYEPEIDLRGQGYSKARATIQVMIDGVPVNMLDSSHRKVPLNTVNPNQIERIEVIPGGGAVLYGNGTAGGVINILTKKHRGNFGNIGYRYGSFGDRKYDIAAGTSLGNFDFALDYSNEDKNGYRRNSPSDSDYFSARIAYNFNKNDTVALKYRGYRAEYKQYNGLSKKQVQEDRRQNGMAPGQKGSTDRKLDEYSFNFHKRVGKNNDLSFHAYKLKTDIKTKSQTPKLTRIVKAEDNRSGVKIKDKWNYGNGNNIIVGAGYTNHTMFLSNIKVEKKTLESFALNTLKFGKLEFSQGLRFEKSKYQGDAAKAFGLKSGETSKTLENYGASLALNYLYSDAGNVYVKYERAFNTPAPLQTIKNINWQTYNSDAKSEKSNTYEIGFRDYILNSIVSASAYYSETANELKTVWLGSHFHDLSNFNTINYGKTKRYGFDLKAEQKFEKFRISESYSFVNAKIIKSGETAGQKAMEGKYIPDVPKHKFVLSTDYDFNEKFSIGASYQYQAAAYIDSRNNLGKEGKKSIVNLRVNYKFNDHFHIYAGIKNLFNAKYYDSVSYATAKPNTIYKVYNPAPSRNYYMGFDYKF
ncbi:Vitamin B12 transporter BtuB [Fusobacterium necrophorum subsp. funduliforme]|nr:Vitamin B12 transporter BtuB [Fusobacterium necrophorum subsp. funduliforme]